MPITQVVSGCCKLHDPDNLGLRSVDEMGEDWADLRGIEVARYPAKWKEQGKPAGPIRNRLMAQNADNLMAFFGMGPKTSGTLNMTQEAKICNLGIWINYMTKSL